jgi:hypothetical protein
LDDRKPAEETSEQKLNAMIEEVFEIDKDSHDIMQQIISDIESQQLELNQVGLSLGKDQVHHDSKLDEQVVKNHANCDKKIADIKAQLQKLNSDKCKLIEEEIKQVVE